MADAADRSETQAEKERKARLARKAQRLAREAEEREVAAAQRRAECAERRRGVALRRGRANTAAAVGAAARDGRLEAVRQLLEQGADANARCAHEPLLPRLPQLHRSGATTNAPLITGREQHGDTRVGRPAAVAASTPAAASQSPVAAANSPKGRKTQPLPAPSTVQLYPTRPTLLPSHCTAPPLLAAAAGGHLDVVQLLAEHGADLNGADDDGTTPFCAACCNGHLATARWLKDHAEVGCCTFDAARRQHWQRVQEAAAAEAAEQRKRQQREQRQQSDDSNHDTGNDEIRESIRLPEQEAMDRLRQVGGADGSGAPAAYHATCLWRQPRRDGRGPLWLASACGRLPLVKYLLQHAEPVRMAMQQAEEASHTARDEAVMLEEQAEEAADAAAEASQTASELRAEEAEHEAEKTRQHTEALKQHTAAASALVAIAVMTKLAMQEKELRLNDDQRMAMTWMLPRKMRDVENNEAADGTEQDGGAESSTDDSDDESEDDSDNDDSEDAASDKDGSGKHGDTDSSGSDAEDQDQVAPEDRPEVLVPRDRRAEALEIGGALVAVAKQYGAPVGKSMAEKHAAATKAHRAVLDAEAAVEEAAAEAARVASPRAEWEARAAQCGARAQKLSRKRTEAETRSRVFEERRGQAERELAVATRELQDEAGARAQCDRTALAVACESGHVDVVKLLVAPPPLVPAAEIERGASSGRTPFHLACLNGHLPVVKYMLEEAGADPYRADSCGLAPFAAACHAGHLQVAIYLRIQGVDVIKVDAVTAERMPREAPRLRALLRDMEELNMDKMDWFRKDIAQMRALDQHFNKSTDT